MNKHTAIDPNGTVHKRNSKGRIYAYTVVVQYSYHYDLDLARLGRSCSSVKANYDFYVSCLGDSTRPSYGVSRDKALEELQGATSLGEYSVAQNIAHIEKKKAEGYYHDWHNVGWCGRVDLANKLHLKMVQHPAVAEVRTLTATVK